jgi:solute carrier family 45 protein 1/2/4
MNLPKAFPVFGNTQFKVLGVIASFSLAITIGISCSYIKEKDPRKERPALQNLSIISCCTLTLRYIPRLSLRIRKVCGIQFAAWCGWLPFLFYSTMFIGQIYANPIFEKDRDLSDGEITKIWEDATRVGTFALLINAVISLVASVVLPLLVTPSDKEIKKPVDASINSEPQRPVSTPDISGWATVNEHNTETHNNRRDLSKFGIPGLTLKRAWLLSHVLFAGCMFSTALISSVQAASAIIGIVGVSWAVTLWAPFAFISAEVAQYNQAEIQSQDVQVRSYDERRMPWATDDYEGPLVDDEDRAANQSGVVLGIHNICVSFPQIISTLISSGIFHALQKPRGEPWDDSVGWVLRFAGCAALLAAFLTNSM